MIAVGLGERQADTAFRVGLRDFSGFLVKVAGVLPVSIFVIDVAFSRPLLDGELSPLAAGDEHGLELAGLLAFVDRPKADAGASIAHLSQLGIAVKVITGDKGRWPSRSAATSASTSRWSSPAPSSIDSTTTGRRHPHDHGLRAGQPRSEVARHQARPQERHRRRVSGRWRQ